MSQVVGQGASITLRVQYQAGDGNPVDPVSPSVSILDPASAVVAGPFVPTRESLGTYAYTYAVASTATLGDWIGRFTGTINGNAVTGDDPFTVVNSGVVVPLVPAPLITLAELRLGLGIDPTDTRNDTKYDAWISYVTDAIKSFTERDFGAPTVTEIRTFEYDGSGFLDIDDASAITDVTLSFPTGTDVLLPTTDWIAKPQRRDDSPVYSYINLPCWAGQGYGSPEMGFMYNLDVYVRDHPYGVWSPTVKVTATWGWPVVPGDVKQAAIWTIEEWEARSSGEGVSAEAIAGWSRSWGSKSGATSAMALSSRAMDLLARYTKMNV